MVLKALELTRLPRAKVEVRRSEDACALRVINSILRQFANSGHKMTGNVRRLCKHLDGKEVGVSTKEVGGWVQSKYKFERGTLSYTQFVHVLGGVMTLHGSGAQSTL